MSGNELPDTELVTDANFDPQSYLLANPDLADPFRDGLDPRAHFAAHGLGEGRRQFSTADRIAPVQRSPSVTLCAIARDERPYLLEWVAYHRLLGFDRIIVYDNDSHDGGSALLGDLAAAGLIEHRPWPDRPDRSAQTSAYLDAVLRCATRWILFLDIDEFLDLKADAGIVAFLARFPVDVAAIGLNWRIFGSAGQRASASDPVVARFDRAAPRDHPLNRQIKTLAVAEAIYLVRPHRVRLMHGRYVDAMGEPLDPGRGFAPVRHRLAQINHYAVKSRAEFDDKRRRGCVLRRPGDPMKLTHRDGSYFADHDRNEDIDRSIRRRLPALLDEMRSIDARLHSSLGAIR